MLTPISGRFGMGRKASLVLVGVRLPPTLARLLKVEAAKRSTTTQALVEAALRAYFGKAVTRGTR